jgi:hypothetical protein
MRNQFFYTAKIGDKEYLASLNVNKIIRTLANDAGGLIIILDDFNERVTEQPDIDLKTNKMRGFKKEETAEINPITLEKYVNKVQNIKRDISRQILSGETQ